MRAVPLALAVFSGCLGDVTTPPPPDAAASAPDLSSTIGPDLATSAAPDLATPQTAYVYVSGYAPQIARFTLDPNSGALTPLGTTAAQGTPSFLAVDPARRHLYTVDEQDSLVQSFAIDPASGALSPINTASSGGSGPAHLSVDRAGGFVLVANYGDGKIAALPIAGDGSVGGAAADLFAGANAHQILTDPTNHFVFVPCLGADAVLQYAFDAGSGALTANTPPEVATAANAGPRHLALHPGGAHAYLVDETASTISALTLDGGGHLAIAQTLSTRAQGATGVNTGAEVWVHPSGRFVYASNRGDDDLAGFALDGSGKMTAIGHTKTGGQTPRSFTIDPSGRFLLVADQGSNDVRVFAIDGGSGALSPVGGAVAAPTPSFVGVVLLP